MFYDSKEDYDAIPEYDQYVKDIAEFDKIDLSTKNYFEVLELFYSTFKLFPASSFSTTLEGQKFFRVRPENTLSCNEDIEKPQTYSYPPAKYCNVKRANLKHQPVLYCSDIYITTFYECNMKVGDCGYLAVWECKAKSPLSYICILPSNIDKNNRWYGHSKNINNTSFSGLVYEKSAQESYLLNYIANKFISEIEPYSLTSVLSDMVLYSNNHVDFLVYPSIQSKLLTCNLAFNPESADKHLSLNHVIKFRIIEKGETNVTFRTELVGDVIGNRVKWREPEEKDLEQFQVLNTSM